MAKTKAELKKCPFCENKTIYWHSQTHSEIKLYGKLYKPFCVLCGASCRGKKTKAEAIIAWNTRPLEDALAGALKKMLSTYNKFWIGLPFSKCQTMTPTEIAKVIIAAEQALEKYRGQKE